MSLFTYHHLIISNDTNNLGILVYNNLKMSWSPMVVNHCAFRPSSTITKSPPHISLSGTSPYRATSISLLRVYSHCFKCNDMSCRIEKNLNIYMDLYVK